MQCVTLLISAADNEEEQRRKHFSLNYSPLSSVCLSLIPFFPPPGKVQKVPKIPCVSPVFDCCGKRARKRQIKGSKNCLVSLDSMFFSLFPAARLPFSRKRDLYAVNFYATTKKRRHSK